MQQLDPQQLSVGTKKWTKALTDSEKDLKWESKEQQRCNMFTRAFGRRKDCVRQLKLQWKT